MFPHLPVLLLLACGTPAPTAHAVLPMPEEPAAAAAGDTLWHVRVRRTRWKPRDVDYLVHLGPSAPNGIGVAATDPVFIGRTVYEVVTASQTDTTLTFRLVGDSDGIAMRFEGRLEGDQAVGLATWMSDGVRNEDPFVATRRTVRRFDVPDPDGRLGKPVTPEEAGIASVLVDRFVLASEEARSDGLLILWRGRPLVARTFGRPEAPVPLREMAGGVAALAGDTERASRADAFRRLAASAGLTSEWDTDALGRPDVDAGLRMTMRDLGVLGTILARGGKHAGKQVVDPGWNETIRASYPEPGIWGTRADPTRSREVPIGYALRDRQGQLLAVYPEADLVVVRTSTRTDNGYDRRYEQRDTFEWAEEMADVLAADKLGLAYAED